MQNLSGWYELLTNENSILKIHCAILYRKDPLNLLCQWQYAILIDTTRQNTIVKLTMRYSIDI